MVPKNSRIKVNLHLLASCFVLWIYPYALFIMAVEATNSVVLSVLIFLPVLTCIAIQRYSIPQPAEHIVREVLGRPLLPGPSKRSLTKNALLASSSVIGGVGCGGGASRDEETPFPIYAHRFAGLDAPENTLEALETCIKNGAKAVEFDVVMTSDYVPVVFHDTKLERMTGLNEDIRNLTYERVQQFDVGKNHPFRGPSVAQIPLFEDVIKKCLQHDLRMVIDIKEDRPEMVTTILETFEKYPALYKRAIVSAFDPYVVYCIRKRNPAIVGGLAWRPYYLSYCTYSPFEEDCIPYHNTMMMYYITRLADLVHTWFFTHLAHQLLGFSAVLISKDTITLELVNFWKDRNVRTMAWTVNSPLEKQYLVKEMGIAYITDTMLGTKTREHMSENELR